MPKTIITHDVDEDIYNSFKDACELKGVKIYRQLEILMGEFNKKESDNNGSNTQRQNPGH